MESENIVVNLDNTVSDKLHELAVNNTNIIQLFNKLNDYITQDHKCKLHHLWYDCVPSISLIHILDEFITIKEGILDKNSNKLNIIMNYFKLIKNYKEIITELKSKLFKANKIISDDDLNKSYLKYMQATALRRKENKARSGPKVISSAGLAVKRKPTQEKSDVESTSNKNNEPEIEPLGYDRNVALQSLYKLETDIDNLVIHINEYLGSKNIISSDKYMLFFNGDNPNVWAFNNNIKLTPGTFKLFQVNTEEENKEYLDSIQDKLYLSPEWRLCCDGGIYSHHIHDDDVNIFKDPGFRRYSGWSKSQLLEALDNTGIFESNRIKYGNKYGYQYPKLQELGINNPCMIHEYRGEKYFSEKMPKYFLEMLYAKTVDTKPNWDEIIDSKFLGDLDQPTEAIRRLFEKEFGILVSGGLPKLKERIFDILNTRIII